ncbi:MAG: GTPase HflX [Bacteroidetes bacterium]|nr:GTPase HflX [Bacteroidota bacterium]
MSTPLYEIKPPTRESAIIVGVIQPGRSRWDVSDSLDELELLADTAGADVTDRIEQKVHRISAGWHIGKGKANSLGQLVAQRNTDLVIFDDDLSPVQLRNLEKELNCKLLDRSALILDIFAKHARTATAKTQVELAQLEYLRTRLTRQWTHLSRQKGGIGTKGPGETQIETDRRMIGQRITALKARLEKIDKQRITQRKGRTDYSRVSLVGYTNAGKSTLMNLLAGSNVLTEDRLFATLDATTRMVQISPRRKVLISDTVGFIRKLPHDLIESFKSTLDEVRESDVLVHVIDATHPQFEEHQRVVHETLKEINADGKLTLLVFNKIDAFENPEHLHILKNNYPEAAFVSAARGIGVSELKQKLISVIDSDYEEEVLFLPVEDQNMIARIRKIGEVLSEEYLDAVVDHESETQVVVRLHFRTACKHKKDIEPIVNQYRDFRPKVAASPSPLPGNEK